LAGSSRPRRIVVVGTSGSGKTTMARRLAEGLGLPHVELDALHWGPGWTEALPEEFRQRTAAALAGEAWTTDGNYGRVRDIVWSRADTLVWLDYSLPVVLWRVISRTILRVARREELWSGNRENLGNSFLSRDSIILWAIKTYRRRQRETPLLLRRPEYSHLQVVHLRSVGQARRWLEEVTRAR
jgi:adenylate kinase family enzyme